ncbi:thiamine phosphate synthase [Rhodoferax fermentans]|uniref:Thiamine phosphate synthase n=1 Tax=Rhodoferax fermentans TaxID=28066 RepID=A0A1T1AUV5_RHOFE|nr:thiamine phosphate synthase [Rhodoferax fermentans]MBK1683763.1 thiamine phosphate synthase [Rhodoferax fermentans]OOV07871.1 thiamine phosphate synthase [Rhodoferax fermentans]
MTHTVSHLAQAIVNAHAALALGASKTSKLFEPPALIHQGPTAIKDEASTEVYQAAHQACLALDFDEADAQLIARAWQAQTQRTGQFDTDQWPTEPEDFGLRPRTDTEVFAPCPQKLGLYAVLPNAAWVGRMARAGVPTVQLRFKSDDAQTITQEVRAAVEAVRGTEALLFINDHWQAAIEAGAYGVHLGQEDLDSLSEADLGAVRSAGLRLGISSHGYAEMLRAAHHGPSYIAMGAVFATTLKRMATPPQGLARLQVYSRLLRHYPTVAIGGIDLDRLGAVLACGVGSVGVVRALVAADQPEAAANALLARMEQLGPPAY